MNNILIIGNGFDSDHFKGIPDLKGINNFKSLKKEIKNENQKIFNKINNTEGITVDWKNLESIKPFLSKVDTSLFLDIVKNWANKIDEKAKNYKNFLFKSNFYEIIKKDNFIVLSLNYTNLIHSIYGVSKTKILQLHVNDNGLPYMDFNNIYNSNNNFEKSFGNSTEIPDSYKIAIGLIKERRILENNINSLKDEVNIYIYGASLNGVDFKYFECLIFYLNNEWKDLKKINMFIKINDDNCEQWKKRINRFFSIKPLKMNLRYEYVENKENVDGDWLNIMKKSNL